MNKQYEMVKDFQEKMNQPVADGPKVLDKKRAEQRYEFMKEELNEFLSASNATDQADGLIDLMYLAFGTFVEMGIEPEKLFEIVHEANMTKLWEDGKSRVNNEGKIIKPPYFQPPEGKLTMEIVKQCQKADAKERVE